MQALPYLCNAALLARPPGGALASLSEAAVARARDASQPVQDRSLGPDLLTGLDRAGSAVARLGGVGLCSPHVVRDLAAGGGPALALFEAVTPVVGAVNLCASTGLGDDVFDAAVDALAARSAPLGGVG